MHISTNMKYLHQRYANYQRKVCHYLGGEREEGVKANGDKLCQGGKGVKYRW